MLNIMNRSRNNQSCWGIGMVTIATNMAGSGTDIKLGEGVKEVVVLR